MADSWLSFALRRDSSVTFHFRILPFSHLVSKFKLSVA